jgi:hypothetical protein
VVFVEVLKGKWSFVKDEMATLVVSSEHEEVLLVNCKYY